MAVNQIERQAIEREAEEVERRTAISALAQRKAANWWGYLFYLVGAPTTALAAVAGGSAVANNTTLAAYLAIGAAVTSSLWVFLNPGGMAREHRIASCHFQALANRARVFANVGCVSGVSNSELRGELDQLVAESSKADEDSPHVAQHIYMGARKKIMSSFADRPDRGGRTSQKASEEQALPEPSPDGPANAHPIERSAPPA